MVCLRYVLNCTKSERFYDLIWHLNRLKNGYPHSILAFWMQLVRILHLQLDTVTTAQQQRLATKVASSIHPTTCGSLRHQLSGGRPKRPLFSF
jgi:hypothetical protein